MWVVMIVGWGWFLPKFADTLVAIWGYGAGVEGFGLRVVGHLLYHVGDKC